jgi:(S)-ureidoglycine aminohydrolase
MRNQNELLTSRVRVKSRYALIPLEGIPASKLPEWPGANVRVLASPQLGAKFVEYLIDLEPKQAGSHKADGRVEYFFYVLSGKVTLTMDGKKHTLGEGGFALVPPTADFSAVATAKSSLLMLRKVYQAAEGIKMFSALVGDAAKIKSTAFYGDEGAQLQLLIPDEMQYDLAMNIFTFEVGHSLPVVETHVMEHGLYVLQGKGVYFLDDTWMEVTATDFIWMGPFCPQSYYATGPVASKYIYYKDVNREIPL